MVAITVENNLAYVAMGGVVDRNALIVMSILLMGLYVWVKTISPKTFREQYFWKRLFSFRIREELATSVRPFSKEFLLFNSLYALNAGYITLLISNFLMEDVPDILHLSNVTYGVVKWLLVSFAFFAATFIKYAAIYLTGSMYGLKNIFSWHFMDFHSSSTIYYTFTSALLSMVIYAFFYPKKVLLEILAVSLVVFLFYRTVMVYIKLAQRSNGGILYIFSYLCTTELIPILIGLKFLIR